MRHKIFFVAFIIAITSYACGFKGQQMDLIVHNAVIHTGDENNTIFEAMAIKDGEIIELGAERTIRNKYQSNKILDAAKQHIYPGFIDAHCHFYGYGLSSNELDLTGTKSWVECLERIKIYARKHSDGWITGRGWDQNDWTIKEYPTNKELNEQFPNRAVFIRRIDGHACIVNNHALSLSKIDKNSRFKGGELILDENKNLTGVLIDNAMNMVYDTQPKPSFTQITEALTKAQEDCVSEGLTTIDDAGLDMDVIDIISHLHASGELKIRVYAMLDPNEKSLKQLKKGKIKTDRLNVRSVKLYGDGALGSRGACMKDDYHDQSGHRGAMIQDHLFYKKWAQNCAKYGFQLNTHCIGDSANASLLQTYANIIGDEKDLRWRIEHAQIVSPSDRHFFKDYGIIPSVQPTHATSDMYWAEERIGKDKLEGAYAYQSLLKQMGIVALGTDFPVEKISPIRTFYAAVTRMDDKNYPPGGFNKNEALTREQALKGMTLWAAISNFEESEKGSLEVGKLADFIVLDRDILTVPDNLILGTTVRYTYIGGEEVFKN